MRILDDVFGAENINRIKEKGRDVVETVGHMAEDAAVSVEAAVTEQYAAAKPKIDTFLDEKVYPTYDRTVTHVARARDAVTDAVVKFLI